MGRSFLRFDQTFQTKDEIHPVCLPQTGLPMLPRLVKKFRNFCRAPRQDERRSVSMDMIENRIFDEIHLGETASLVRTLSREDIDLFAVMSGDVNPAHLDEDYAKSD